MAEKKQGGLGRGFDSMGLDGIDLLFGGAPTAAEKETEIKGSSALEEISLDLIDAKPDQPRKDFDAEAMTELANSIKEVGVIQAITVRKIGDRYQIISGERRYRASKLAGKTTIPAYIKDVDERAVHEMALIENIQRQDLNVIEEALAYKNLMTCYSLTQEQVSERVGKSRSYVTNFLRILNLPDIILVALKNKVVDMGHARALLGFKREDGELDEEKVIKAFNIVTKNHLSVRKTEELVKEMNSIQPTENTTPTKPFSSSLNDEYKGLESKLQGLFTKKTSISCNSKGAGKITIPFSNDEEMQKIFELLDMLG
ncbi:MAG: ParB/RepB/Spo0J family partition protein [Paludibacteraceae bacterium]|nr:ParB/RepB/Spo0J family partition protein [Paludibacteraceae bacterium]